MVLTLGCTVIALSLPSTGLAATTVGQLANSTNEACDGANNNLVQSRSAKGRFAMPFKGVITSWAHKSRGISGSKLKLKVFRRGRGGKFKSIGESKFRKFGHTGVVRNRAHIRVRKGDVLGLGLAGNAASSPASCFDPGGSSGDKEYARNGDIRKGHSGKFPAGPFQVRLNVSVRLKRQSHRSHAVRSSLGDQISRLPA